MMRYNLFMNNKIKTAFTLVELLVVIAIVGILSGLIIVGMSSSVNNARIAKAQIFNSSLRDSLMMNMLGEWKFDEGAGTVANDTWTKINNGNLTNFTNTTAGYGDTNSDGWMSSSNCISGTCIKFDGTDDYVNCGTDSSLIITGAFTLSVWMKLGILGTDEAVVGKGYAYQSAADYGYYIRKVSNNKVYFIIHSTSAYDGLFSVSAISDTNWHLVTATWDGTTNTNGKKVYIDGKLDNQGTSTISAMGTAASANFAIGGNTNGTLPFNGSIDDVRVYNVTIPSSRIKEQYYAGLNRLLANNNISKTDYKNELE